MSLDGVHAVIYSLKGCALSDDERSFFTQANPLGFILFARNCETPDQLRRLSDDLRMVVGRDCPILVDQEGGRVQRLKPPVWRSYPAMKHFGDLAAGGDEEKALEDLRFTMLQLGEELAECGVNVNCAPVLDVLSAVTHDVIGDRAFADDPALVGRLGLSVCRHLLAMGVVPVVKHLPGHGLARVDSHKDLPRVDASYEGLFSIDFEPFRIIFGSEVADRVWGMMAHVVYEALDPVHPASVSARVINDTVRGEMGFDGVLVSDDLGMEALARYGGVDKRALACLEAGCDVALYCGAVLPEMEKIADIVPKLSAKAMMRLQKSFEIFNIGA